jgi:hypothetical protein
VAALAFLALAVGGLIASRYTGILFRISANLHPSDAAYANLLATAGENHPVRISLTMVLVAGASAMALFFAWKRRAPAAAWCIALAELGAISMWTGLLMPEFARERTLKSFVVDARKIVGNHEVMIAGAPNYEVSYYFGRGVPVAPKDFEADPRKAMYLFLWGQQIDQLHTTANRFQGSVLLTSQPTSNRRRMLLLSLDGEMPAGISRSSCAGRERR